MAVVVAFSAPDASSEGTRFVPCRGRDPARTGRARSWLTYARRCERGSPWRKLGCFELALLAPIRLCKCKNDTPPVPAAGFGVSTSAAWRYTEGTPGVVAAWVPGLHEALTGVKEGDFVIVDSTLIPPTASARTNRTS
ncbi:hypothetical protein [Streptomyces sp. NPDC013181]|uniref:hypothetical protein n=1 Tax=Streptomyces sp. NPDC013181 TaxID=3364864 RepID=UPI0036A271EC